MSLPSRAVGKPLFRRSKHLVCYWNGGSFFVHNYATGMRTRVSPLVAQTLHGLDDWSTHDTVARGLPGARPAVLRRVLAGLERHSLIERSDHPANAKERLLEQWKDWNPAAGLFHFSTKDTRFPTRFNQAERALSERARLQPPPPPIKRYRNVDRVRLPRSVAAGEFPTVLTDRRTWRRFSRQAVPLASLATALHLTWGVQRWGDVEGQGRIALKTSPSGGARHPIEVYVLALNVAGLQRGVYHYRCDQHSLERLRARVRATALDAYLPSQPWFKNAAALFIMTAVFAREQWRYPVARAYRAVLLDAGHLCQTFCLVATWLGLAPFCSMALADSVIERDLRLDGVTESVIYVAGVGVRPRGGWRS